MRVFYKHMLSAIPIAEAMGCIALDNWDWCRGLGLGRSMDSADPEDERINILILHVAHS